MGVGDSGAAHYLLLVDKTATVNMYIHGSTCKYPCGGREHPYLNNLNKKRVDLDNGGETLVFCCYSRQWPLVYGAVRA
jgi:hypothetical protein